MEQTDRTKGFDSTPDANRDPITGTAGSHPVGTGLGAVAGGVAAGAAAGTIAGPVGTLVGAALGAVAGAFAGKGIAEMIDPTVEDAYWRDSYESRPYVDSGATFDDYGPAYRYGYESYPKYHGRTFDDSEAELSRDWDRAKGDSSLAWDKAKHATKDSFQRVSDAVERATPGIQTATGSDRVAMLCLATRLSCGATSGRRDSRIAPPLFETFVYKKSSFREGANPVASVERR